MQRTARATRPIDTTRMTGPSRATWIARARILPVLPVLPVLLLLLVFVVLLAALATGCGYSFTGSNLPGHIRTVAIPNFENDTLEPQVGQEATAGILEAFMRDGRLKLAPEAQADSRLIGRVVRYENKVQNYSADQTPRDYIVVLTIAVTLRDQVKNRDLWRDDEIVRTAVYEPGSGTLTGEEEARRDAITRLAADLVTRTLEQW